MEEVYIYGPRQAARTAGDTTMARFPVPSGSSFLFIGDSITDCDRMTYAAPLGSGYVRMFADMVTWHHPELDIRWINQGVGGDVIGDLRERWVEDVLAHEPDWLAVMIGINDCHGNIDGDEAWAEQAYYDDYAWLLDQVRPLKPQLVLLDPFYVTTAAGPWPVDDFQRRVLTRLAAYRRVMARVTRENSAIRVKTQEMFHQQLQHRSPGFFGPEPVHPAPVGHTMVALELYRTLMRPVRPPDAVAKPASTRRRPSRRVRRRG
jgi:acyl-CoA thioesterase I